MSALSLAAYFGKPARAAPLHNHTASPDQFAPAWVTDPPGRGTWNLLYSCVFTLILCVWTSVHLNVPGHGEGAWIMFRRKMKWVLIALLAPELVVFVALQQWWAAKVCSSELQRLHQHIKGTHDDNSMSMHKFDMAYAMYAVMGGFAVDIEHLHNKLKRATLTTNGLLLLAQEGHFCYIDPKTIEDKSKANLLAKGLVCVQVLWVAGQAIERKVAGFPISLLEYHTLVHVVCALVMYTLWFRKPYDIQFPTLVPTDEYSEALSFIVASSTWPRNSGFKSLNPATGLSSIFLVDEDPPFSWFGSLESSPVIKFDQVDTAQENPLDVYDPRLQNHLLRIKADDPDVYFAAERLGNTFSPVSESGNHISIASGQSLRSGLGPIAVFPKQDGYDGTLPGYRVHLSQKDTRRLDNAGSFIIKLLASIQSSSPRITTKFNDPAHPTSYWSLTKEVSHRSVFPALFPFEPGHFRGYGKNLICHRSENVMSFSEMFESSSSVIRIVASFALVVISAAYGAIHLSAIESDLPTSLELTIWTIACYILLGSAATFVLGSTAIVFLLIHDRIPRWLADKTSTTFRNLLAAFLFFLGLDVILLYVSARVFIVVESFISLRRVPAGVYDTPDTNFMSYIPHF